MPGLVARETGGRPVGTHSCGTEGHVFNLAGVVVTHQQERATCHGSARLKVARFMLWKVYFHKNSGQQRGTFSCDKAKEAEGPENREDDE